MNWLAIDTSTELASVALSFKGEIFCEEQKGLRQHAQLLLPMIQGLLTQVDLNFKDLTGVVFGSGPGSFTGLRIACSVAKSLGYAHDLPLYPISSLAAIAHHVFQTETDLAPDAQVLSMMDARMDQLYWAYFKRDMEGGHVHVTAAADISCSLSTPLIVAGVGFEAYASQCPVIFQNENIKKHVVFPSAKAMIELAQTGKCHPVTASEALPMYVRNQVTQGETRG